MNETKVLLTILVDDDGISYRATENSQEIEFADCLHNYLSLGGQYLVLKVIDDLECDSGDWTKKRLTKYFANRLDELNVLKKANFVSNEIDFEFLDERTADLGDGDESDEMFDEYDGR